MLNKILIANRERSPCASSAPAKSLGSRRSPSIPSPISTDLHVQLADEAICIGPAPSNESYLKIDRIISAAEIVEADAIHPGYGFLAENAHFAEVCASCNIKFIGPPPNAIRLMGDKNSARECARQAGVPVSPGSDGTVDSEAEARKIAKKIGYPVMIKAVAGGGGRGMRIATDEETLVNGYHSARLEAEKGFRKRGGVYREVYRQPAPHRVPSVRRRARSHRPSGRARLLDPAPQSEDRRGVSFLAHDGRTPQAHGRRIGQKLAEGVGYVGAGTMEYLVDDNGDFYFMEMNTRIQVEHPITEEVYGCDLVKQQIQVAAGEHLSDYVVNAKPRHHAIECRINAEDPSRNFMPCPGEIELYYAPGGRGVRIDSHAYAGYPIPPNYDSMIAKVIATASSREACINRMYRALGEYMITGVKTTIPFQMAIMQNEDFRRGTYDTGFVEKMTKAGKLPV